MINGNSLKELAALKPDLIVLSTLQGMIGARDWNTQQDMADVNSFIVRMCRDICPIIMITHSPQDTKQKRAIGTVSQAANYAVLGHITKKRQSGTEFAEVKLDSKLGGGNRFTLKLQTQGEEVKKT